MIKRAMSIFVLDEDAAGDLTIVDTRTDTWYGIGSHDYVSYDGVEDFLEAVEREIKELKNERT